MLNHQVTNYSKYERQPINLRRKRKKHEMLPEIHSPQTDKGSMTDAAAQRRNPKRGAGFNRECTTIARHNSPDVFISGVDGASQVKPPTFRRSNDSASSQEARRARSQRLWQLVTAELAEKTPSPDLCVHTRRNSEPINHSSTMATTMKKSISRSSADLFIISHRSISAPTGIGGKSQQMKIRHTSESGCWIFLPES
jgi:hypothetical protein